MRIIEIIRTISIRGMWLEIRLEIRSQKTPVSDSFRLFVYSASFLWNFFSISMSKKIALNNNTTVNRKYMKLSRNYSLIVFQSNAAEKNWQTKNCFNY